MSGHHPGSNDFIVDAPKEPAGTSAQNSPTACMPDCLPGASSTDRKSSRGVFSVLETTQPQSCHKGRDQKESDVKITTVTVTNGPAVAFHTDTVIVTNTRVCKAMAVQLPGTNSFLWQEALKITEFEPNSL